MAARGVSLMISDDCVVVVREALSSVSECEGSRAFVVCVASEGFPGAYDAAVLAHVYEHGNPHCDAVFAVSAGGSGWFKLGESGVVATSEVPVYREDVHPVVSRDGMVKCDVLSGCGTLAEFAAFPLWTGRLLRLRGDERVTARCFYGTNAAGSVGLLPVPGEAVIP